MSGRLPSVKSLETCLKIRPKCLPNPVLLLIKISCYTQLVRNKDF